MWKEIVREFGEFLVETFAYSFLICYCRLTGCIVTHSVVDVRLISLVKHIMVNKNFLLTFLLTFSRIFTSSSNAVKFNAWRLMYVSLHYTLKISVISFVVVVVVVAVYTFTCYCILYELLLFLLISRTPRHKSPPASHFKNFFCYKGFADQDLNMTLYISSVFSLFY